MFFEGGSDDDEGGTASAVEAVCQRLFVELMKVKPSLVRTVGGSYWMDSIAGASSSSSGGGGGGADRIVGSINRKVALVTSTTDDVCLCGDVVRIINTKLRIGKFVDIVHHGGGLAELQGSYDVLVLAGGRCGEQLSSRATDTLVSGGLLAAITIGHSSASPAAALDEEEWVTLGSLSPPGSALRIDSWQRRLCRRNPLGAMSIIGSYTDTAAAAGVSGQEERASIAQCCIPLSSEERRLRVLTDPCKAKLARALTEHGLAILPGLFDSRQVLALGAAFTEDMAHAALQLKLQGVDIFTGHSSSGGIDNYRELATREARRCDLRNSPAATALVSSGACPTLAVLECTDLVDALQQTMNPAAGPDARGNWGRWNFEGDGPDLSPPPIRQHPLGCVMSLPGCADQTIHTDTAHLQVCSQLPPHYLNLFLPASMDEGDMRLGQTAFVLGTHTLRGCADVMVREGGDALLLRRLVRPHLRVGDALLFDTRILHFGLANQSEEGAGEGAWRPILYANVTQAWFSDPKNWDDRKRLFE